MSLRLRVFLLLAGLLVLTLLAGWTMTTGGVLRPLMRKLVEERVDMALHMAEEIESADDPRRKARHLGRRLGVEARLSREAPPHMLEEARPFERDGRRILVLRAPGSPLAVPLQPAHGPPAWLLVRFPADLDAPPRRIGLGLVLLGLVALGGSVVVVRWMLRPLELASEAMERVADGDLSHRAPAGQDAAGRMGATFNRMADRVQGLVQGQRELMAAVSHELRTPLTRMRLQAELLRESGADPDRLDALERDIATVDDLVDEILESSRLDRGLLALQLEPVSLYELSTEALGAVDLGERPVQLDVPEPLLIQADRKRLLRVLTNLLSNIARYTPEDCPVELHARQQDGWTTITLADRGPGVPEAALDRLFDPFFRAESSRSRRTGGLGLGLMLCRQIAEAHGGRIGARIRPGGGLEISLKIPSHRSVSPPLA